MEITTNNIISVIVWIVALAIVVRFTVEALKAQAALSEQNAGKINQAVSFVAAIGLFVLQHFGFAEEAVRAETLGNDLAIALITWPVLFVLAFLIHKVTKIVEGRFREDTKESSTPALAAPK